MGKLYDCFKILCTDFEPNFEKKGDTSQGNMYLDFDFFQNQVVPDLRRVLGLLFML